MISESFAEHFAVDWIGSWNSHDIDRVLSHYAHDFTMHSPLIVQVAGEPSGVLKGVVEVRAYWTKALLLMPGLSFELISILVGVNSVTIYYKSARSQPVAEVLHFGPDRKVVEAYAHYGV